MARVYTNGRATIYKNGPGRATAFPDVCLCPPPAPSGPVPTPLSNTVIAADLDNCAAHVTIAGNPVAHRDSHFKKSTGNEVSRPTGGGVVSHAVQGRAIFRSYSPNVFIEGKPAVRHADLLTQNHTGQTGNTPPSVWMSSVDPNLPSPKPGRITRAINEGKHFVTIALKDRDGNAVENARYRLTTPTGTIVEGRTPFSGAVTVRGLPKGTCKVEWLDEGLDPQKRD